MVDRYKRVTDNRMVRTGTKLRHSSLRELARSVQSLKFKRNSFNTKRSKTLGKRVFFHGR